MNKPRNRQTIRVSISLRVDTQTDAAIRRLAADLGLSQSEVVDRAVALLVETAMKEEPKNGNTQE